MSKDVTIYTSYGSGQCTITKMWLQERDVQYRERKLHQPNVRKELALLGFETTPVVIVDDTAIIGFNPTELSAALELE